MATSKYSDIEIQTAENLLKRGFKWITRGIYGAIIAYKIKPDQEKYISGNVMCSDLVPIFESIRCGDDPVSLESIVHPQILDDVERRYLSAVIRPFRERVWYIRKAIADDTSVYKCSYYIFIRFNDGTEDMKFPVFHEPDMYKGMKFGKTYTPKELGL